MQVGEGVREDEGDVGERTIVSNRRGSNRSGGSTVRPKLLQAPMVVQPCEADSGRERCWGGRGRHGQLIWALNRVEN